MASFASQTACYGPNPPIERGEGIKIYASPDGSKIIYGSGSTVVIRDVKNPAECDVYTKHKAYVTVAKFSPDGKLVASADANGVLHVWEWESPDKETKKEMMCLGAKVTDLAWDEEGKRIAVGGDSKTQNARVFMWSSGSAQGELSGATKGVLGIDIRPGKPGRLVTACADAKVRLYGGPPFKFIMSHEDHKNFVQQVSFSPDGTMYVSVSNDSNVFIYDSENGNKIGALPKEHKGSIYSFSWHADSTRLMTASGDKTVKLWDVKAKKCLATIDIAKKPEVKDMQAGCVFAGDQMISVSLDGTFNFLDPKKPKGPVRVVQANTSTPSVIRSDGVNGTGMLYSAGQSGEVVAYDASGAGRRVAGEQHAGSIVDMCVVKGIVYTVGFDDMLRCFDPAKLQFTKQKIALGAQPTGVAASSKNPDLVAVSTNKGVLLIRGFKVVADVETEKNYSPVCVSISKGGTEVIVGGSDKAAHVFKASKDKITDTGVTYSGLQGVATVVRHSPDGKHVAVGDRYKEITLWDRASGKVVVRNKWVFHTASITDLAFSPDGSYLASTSVDSAVIVWNVAKPMAKTQLKLAHYNGSKSVTWLDDATLCSSGYDYCIRRWTPKLP